MNTGLPPSGSVTAAARTFFGLGPERVAAVVQHECPATQPRLVAGERQLTDDQVQAAAGAPALHPEGVLGQVGAMPLEGRMIAFPPEGAAAVLPHGEAMTLLAGAAALRRTASNVTNSPSRVVSPGLCPALSLYACIRLQRTCVQLYL